MGSKFLNLILFLSIKFAIGQSCPSVVSPVPNATNISVNTKISWTAVEDATGYYVLIGTTPGGRDLVDREDVGTKTEFILPEGTSYPANTIISVKITVRFQGRPDQTCGYELFTTGNAESQQGCGHFINTIPDFYACDLDDDNYEEFNINLAVLETQLIADQIGLTITYHDEEGNTIDFSLGNQFAINERVIIARATNAEGCSEDSSFKLIVSSPPTVIEFDDVTVCEQFILPRISGLGDYFTASNGQGTALFEGDTIYQTQTIYVYSKIASCSDEESFDVTINSGFCDQITNLKKGFPKFFTPNNDGINDFWQYAPPEEVSPIEIARIDIFNRYGTLLRQIDPTSQGWNGNFNGKPLPASDYWFKAITFNQREIYGHFSLKR